MKFNKINISKSIKDPFFAFFKLKIFKKMSDLFSACAGGLEELKEYFKKGHGIENMKARIERLNGEFSISSQPSGAIIEFTVPI